MTEHSQLIIKNELTELEKVAQWIDQLGGKAQLPPKTLFELNLALDELVTNIIKYAYEDNERHEITVTCDLDKGMLQFAVIDDGKIFDPLSLPDPDIDAPLEEREAGGLGIYFIRQLMDEVKYERADQLNILTLKKKLSRP